MHRPTDRHHADTLLWVCFPWKFCWPRWIRKRRRVGDMATMIMGLGFHCFSISTVQCDNWRRRRRRRRTSGRVPCCSPVFVCTVSANISYLQRASRNGRATYFSWSHSQTIRCAWSTVIELYPWRRRSKKLTKSLRILRLADAFTTWPRRCYHHRDFHLAMMMIISALREGRKGERVIMVAHSNLHGTKVEQIAKLKHLFLLLLLHRLCSRRIWHSECLNVWTLQELSSSSSSSCLVVQANEWR